MINELAKKIHESNKAKGFYESEKNIGEMLALIHSEVSEALEADRKGRHCKLDQESLDILTEFSTEDGFNKRFNLQVKDTFQDEIADVMIRCMDLAAYLNMDIEGHIKAKLRYNSLRAFKHGKKY